METSQLRPVYYWLWTGIFLISLMVVVGGITRLTDSGLSMSEWNLIMGTIPPLSEIEWQHTFEIYKEFPQYLHLNGEMELFEFKRIFFWEYFHRLIGRFIGIVFLIPFSYFWAKGYFNTTLLKRMFILLTLGAFQGAMGWIMVKSGLVDNPYVSHYRLAMHFMLAFTLIGFCLWYALDLRNKTYKAVQNPHVLKRIIWVVAALFIIQVLYGAFTAGLDAGFMYNTFPKMAGEWVPPTYDILNPFLRNLVENPGTVQWIHRLNGTALLISVIILWWKSVFGNSPKWLLSITTVLLCILVVQYFVGVLTLIYHVPIILGILHQSIALLFGIVLIITFHRIKII